jgi:hypothetical protein
MEKRYQVFVSSTYSDLKSERQKVIQTLMEMDCIPAGMEMFPAFDEEQWLFIKKIIEDCDYYILIIGGRYGSVDLDGVSYTEKEYDYAIEKGLKVIAFIHENPDLIISGKTEKDPGLVIKLNNFIEKVKKGRLVRFWGNEKELPGLVALSLSKTIKTYPAIGWVRANSIGSSELLNEINSLRKKNDELIKQISFEEKIEDTNSNLAEMTQHVNLFGRRQITQSSVFDEWGYVLSWQGIFHVISPYLYKNPSDDEVKEILITNINKITNSKPFYSDIDEQLFQTIKIQLLAYKLIELETKKDNKGLIIQTWNMTQKGFDYMVEIRTQKKA